MTFSAGQTVEAMRFQELDGRGLPLGTLPPAVPLGAECLPTRRVLVKFRVFPRIQPQPIRRQIAATPASQNRRSRGSTCRQSRLAASEAKGRSCAAAFCRLCRNSFKDKHSLFLRSKTNAIRHAAREHGSRRGPVKSLGEGDFDHAQDPTAQSFYGEDALTRTDPPRPRRRSG